MSNRSKQTKPVTTRNVLTSAKNQRVDLRHVGKDAADQTAAANQAVSKLVKQIDDHPEDYHLNYELATVLLDMQDVEQAEELLIKSRGLFSDDDQATNLLTYGLGNVYYQAAAYDKAAAEFAKVTDEKLQLDAYQMLAQTYTQQNNYQKAFAFALTVHDANKQDPTANALLGDILMAMGNFNQAADFYDQALMADPKNGKVNFNRGLTAMVLGQDEAPFMKAAEQNDPDYVKRSQEKVNDIATLIKKQQ